MDSHISGRENLVKPAGQYMKKLGYNRHRHITIRGIVSVRRINFGNAQERSA